MYQMKHSKNINTISPPLRLIGFPLPSMYPIHAAKQLANKTVPASQIRNVIYFSLFYLDKHQI
jgi:hypothetical protein